MEVFELIITFLPSWWLSLPFHTVRYPVHLWNSPPGYNELASQETFNVSPSDFNVVYAPKRWASFYVVYVLGLTAFQIWWGTISLSSVGLASSIVGKYLAFVLICWLQQMDWVYQRGQEKVACLEGSVSWGCCLSSIKTVAEWDKMGLIHLF